MAEINLFFVIGAALVDSINPCAFGVLIFLLAYLEETVRKARQMLVRGLVYIGAVFVTYLVAGLVLLPFIRKLGSFSVVSYYVLAAIIALAGLLEVKDFFWYGRGISLAIFPSESRRIKMYVQGINRSPFAPAFLGVFVALVELPCTGFAYLAVLGLVSLSGVTISNLSLLIIYNLIFVLPLLVILWFVYRGASTQKFERWRQRHKKWMRLAIGLTLLALAGAMLWFVEYGASLS
ncbi:MAG TPA: GAP family protein [Candidatus Nanoarchaeia archaeon]|nr:GAP family protein [Candidatus Nanoarchaeia archaeon]